MSDGFLALHPVLQHHIVTTLRWPGLRPLQNASVTPLLAGEDAILLAPTAGGKTEAATFPLLSRMASEDWAGVSVLYICPLKALLNNLEPRLAHYASWLGRAVSVWHGDVGASARKRIKRDKPDILLTTPESLEAMMVSQSVDDRDFLGDVRAVIIDEVHAFAGDDRGWHLSAVLARLEHHLRRPVQRVGMSATVGNPDSLLGWLQGGQDRPGRVINPPVESVATAPEIWVDKLEDIDQVARLLSRMHLGEKRLVFVDSRMRAEELAGALRREDTSVYLSHSSLSAVERREAEHAFATATDCIIVATSTLELGIDIGDLDRVIQIGTPRTVSSFLQRLGRTGRRPGTVRNCLFISLKDDVLLETLGMLYAWSTGYVEPVNPPPVPMHMAAQQFLAAALHKGAINTATWKELWAGSRLMNPDVLGRDGQEILDHLVSVGMLEVDGALAFIGEAAEKAFGRRHFMELLSAFTTPPMFTVLSGRREIGTVELKAVGSPDPDRVLLIALAGRSWKVETIDWRRRRLYVEPIDKPAKTRWGFLGPGFGSAVSEGMRQVLLGSDPGGVRLTDRAKAGIESLRLDKEVTVSPDSRVILEHRGANGGGEWWTWAGDAHNTQVIAALAETGVVRSDQVARHDVIGLSGSFDSREVRARVEEVMALPVGGRPLPAMSVDDARGLKFSEALPMEWALHVLAVRQVTE